MREDGHVDPGPQEVGSHRQVDAQAEWAVEGSTHALRLSRGVGRVPLSAGNGEVLVAVQIEEEAVRVPIDRENVEVLLL